MTLQFDCGSLMIKATPSFQLEFQNLLHFVLFGITMFEFQLKRKDPSIVESQSMWNFGS